LISQKYSRDHELEADYYGMQYMARAGYDPRAAITLQETFVRLAKGRDPGWLEGLFASHPPSQERVDANRETAKALPAGGEVAAERYQRMIAQLKKAEPAYAAYDQGRKALAKKDYAKALALADQAIAIEPREGRFHDLRADALLGQRNINGAVAEYSRSISLNDGYFYPFLMRGLIRERQGDKAGARSDLLASYRLLPTEPAQKSLRRLGVR
jgi:predicted Zn-dependent protease